MAVSIRRIKFAICALPRGSAGFVNMLAAFVLSLQSREPAPPERCVTATIAHQQRVHRLPGAPPLGQSATTGRQACDDVQRSVKPMIGKGKQSPSARCSRSDAELEQPGMEVGWLAEHAKGAGPHELVVTITA
ncbi:hypothetical protein GCM10011611_18210 [Aliidongia dinghuensis]|uniref:Uncharacterized protein n=1 Tax=Aliidongia dinghuensis TaxID=1867774 RepID=A0A8J2YT59_9PROT|nr:hypothetical protein GCM10011611_18210 [Aliidongia dinghuensis]